jgi:hypothetical protein
MRTSRPDAIHFVHAMFSKGLRLCYALAQGPGSKLDALLIDQALLGRPRLCGVSLESVLDAWKRSERHIRNANRYYDFSRRGEGWGWGWEGSREGRCVSIEKLKVSRSVWLDVQGHDEDQGRPAASATTSVGVGIEKTGGR